jgi:holo-[acyl-carrier protein] synthase
VLLVGFDICKINRFDFFNNNNAFAKKISTDNEIKSSLKFTNKKKFFSSLFASKEAFAKALKCGFGKELSFNDIEILNNMENKPEIKILNKNKKILNNLQEKNIFLTQSSCREYSVASVIIYKNKDGLQ